MPSEKQTYEARRWRFFIVFPVKTSRTSSRPRDAEADPRAVRGSAFRWRAHQPLRLRGAHEGVVLVVPTVQPEGLRGEGLAVLAAPRQLVREPGDDEVVYAGYCRAGGVAVAAAVELGDGLEGARAAAVVAQRVAEVAEY